MEITPWSINTFIIEKENYLAALKKAEVVEKAMCN